jgi:hypothetical protein
MDRNPRLGSNLCPNVARASGKPPGLAALLPGYGDEPEVADRSAIGFAVALDDHDAFAMAGCRPGVRKTDDPSTNDGDIEA